VKLRGVWRTHQHWKDEFLARIWGKRGHCSRFDGGEDKKVGLYRAYAVRKQRLSYDGNKSSAGKKTTADRPGKADTVPTKLKRGKWKGFNGLKGSQSSLREKKGAREGKGSLRKPREGGGGHTFNGKSRRGEWEWGRELGKVPSAYQDKNGQRKLRRCYRHGRHGVRGKKKIVVILDYRAEKKKRPSLNSTFLAPGCGSRLIVSGGGGERGGETPWKGPRNNNLGGKIWELHRVSPKPGLSQSSPEREGSENTTSGKGPRKERGKERPRVAWGDTSLVKGENQRS